MGPKVSQGEINSNAVGPKRRIKHISDVEGNGTAPPKKASRDSSAFSPVTESGRFSALAEKRPPPSVCAMRRERLPEPYPDIRGGTRDRCQNSAGRALVDKVAGMKLDFIKIRVDDNLGTSTKVTLLAAGTPICAAAIGVCRRRYLVLSGQS
jgi:hypothetical protein